MDVFQSHDFAPKISPLYCTQPDIDVMDAAYQVGIMDFVWALVGAFNSSWVCCLYLVGELLQIHLLGISRKALFSWSLVQLTYIIMNCAFRKSVQ